MRPRIRSADGDGAPGRSDRRVINQSNDTLPPRRDSRSPAFSVGASDMYQGYDAPGAALESFSPLSETDPVCAARLDERVERALEAVDRIQEAARVTPDDLRLHVTM